MRAWFLGAAILASCSSSNEGAPAVDAAPADSSVTDSAADAGLPRDHRILSAFFGLDNALPAGADFICPGSAGKDGMPVVFSRRVSGTPAAAAFRVTTQSGAQKTPVCATLAPAIAASERHTVLLGGDFGDEPGDPPLRIEIVDSIPLEGGADARGLSADVTPLAAGPSVVLAMRYLPSQLTTSACPVPATKQIVQITWNGGVNAPAGATVGEAERARIHVVVVRDGGSVELVPDALADLNDNDNYL